MPTPRAASALGSTCTRTAYFCWPEHLHLRHAVDGRDALREVGLGVFVDRRDRQRVRGEREEEHREIGRVDLAERRRRRHGRRQLRARPRRSPNSRPARRRRCRGRALNWMVMRVDALAAHRGHLVDAGDGRELLLEHRRHRRGHGLRARAGQLGRDLDGGEVDVGQRRHRQQAVGAPCRKSGCPAMTSTVMTGTADEQLAEDSRRLRCRLDDLHLRLRRRGAAGRASRPARPSARPLGDDGALAVGARDRDLAQLGGHVGLDHVDVLAARARSAPRSRARRWRRPARRA